MKIPTGLVNLVIKSLSESMNVTTMQSLARMYLHNYDLYRKTGFPESIAIPGRDAARQIVMDINQGGYLIHFINTLYDVQNNGLMGKKYSISHIREIVNGVIDLGYIFDNQNKLFVEDPRIHRTKNWGILLDGADYLFTFLRLDIVGNTQLVKKYEKDLVKSVYADIRQLFETGVNKFNGRIWSWEGDGGLAAFFFSNTNLTATLTGLQFINEIFLYNTLECKLEEPVELRLAVHTGSCEYKENQEELLNSEIIKKTMAIESDYTKPNSLTVSNVVYITLGKELGSIFQPVSGSRGGGCFNYELRWEK